MRGRGSAEIALLVNSDADNPNGFRGFWENVQGWADITRQNPRMWETWRYVWRWAFFILELLRQPEGCGELEEVYTMYK